MLINSFILHERNQFVEQQRSREARHIGHQFQDADAVELIGEAGV